MDSVLSGERMLIMSVLLLDWSGKGASSVSPDAYQTHVRRMLDACQTHVRCICSSERSIVCGESSDGGIVGDTVM